MFRSFPDPALLFVMPFAMALTVTDCAAQMPVVLEDSVTQAIDAEVWHPFVAAFKARDVEAFMAVHSEQVLRWALGWAAPMTADTLRVQAMRNWKADGVRAEERTIELFFSHRSHTASFAYDIGYYRVRMWPNEGPPREFHGHFSTILGREDGRWKILLDADNGEGVTPEDVQKGLRLHE